MKKEIERLEDHVIVCGGGRYGKEILEQFTSSEEEVVVIDNDSKKLATLGADHPEMLSVLGDATSTEVLESAGLHRAKALIATLSDDSDNAFLVLSARELAPKVKIIARVYKSENNSKLLKVGADYVVQPEQIGSFFMATIVRKPSAIEFFRSIASGPGAAIGFEEIGYDALPAQLRGGSLLDMDLRRQTGVSIVALRFPDGHYEVNPDPKTKLSEGTSLIALGDQAQLNRLRTLLPESPEVGG